ncbi:hypothetical protein ONS95_010473 [Cadophora gregata]|uniref:uncharacterized protein n=1 Tax=Cadophora gregata TaxID=51156 RepID=UPI0026DC9A6E|nr:uncharacterized protein ONS95_010473 [Cadophora gregata]KAK0122218.1 hypothetical protein ONS95_010473 [Cadophora gregata]KAK0127696.1 hypothetical protein ONS96_007214 [Cadophora gregata f. sp. sojae]
MKSQPAFTLFPQLAFELRLRIWEAAFPVLSTSSVTVPIQIDRTIHLLYTTSTVVPARIYYTYRLSAPLAPLPPPHTNREVYNEYQRRYPVILDLLPDLHDPASSTNKGANSANAGAQKIRFNPDKDTIFIDLHSLFSLSDILQSPPSLKTLARFSGFDQIRHLSTPLDKPNIFGLFHLTRWLFTGLPSTPASASTSNPKDTLTSQIQSIAFDISFHPLSKGAHATEVDGPHVHPGESMIDRLLLNISRINSVDEVFADELDMKLRPWEQRRIEAHYPSRDEYLQLRAERRSLQRRIDAQLSDFFQEV